jgi:hypothetical protein
VLTDGHTQVPAHFSPECAPHLPLSPALHDVIAVRKYTIRYTSYGPPRDRLQFILHAVDWLGGEPETEHLPNIESLKPLWTEDILDVLQQLENTRANEDRKCLVSGISIEEETPDIMDGTDDLSQGASQPHTQFAFGTQVAHPVRVRPPENNPQFLGMNRLEPVLAGNTQREELLPKPVKPGIRGHEALLSLLARSGNLSNSISNKTKTDMPPRTSLNEPQTAVEASGSELFTQPPNLVNRQPTQTQTPVAAEETAAASPQPTPSTKKARDIPVVSPRAETSVEQANPPISGDESGGIDLQALASECSWMKDFEFSHEALKVPYDQISLLQKESSWHKPQPGHRFPDGNVPITILTTLHRLADESAAMEAGPDSDDEMDEDPSPEFPTKSSYPSVGSATKTTQDDHLPSSRVSWSVSPSPEPPKLTGRLNRGLPPDSSFEVAEAIIDSSTNEAPPPLQPRNPIIIESSNETDEDALPSSPPIEEESTVFDEDMEMEEHVPQGLGEDTQEEAVEILKPSVLSRSPSPKSFVQVEETPYPKGKGSRQNGRISSVSPQNLGSSAITKKKSSSIIYGTYNDKTRTKAANNPHGSDVAVVTREGIQEHSSVQLEKQQHTSPERNTRVLIDVVPDVTMRDPVLAVSPQTEHTDLGAQSAKIAIDQIDMRHLLPNTTPVSAQAQTSIPSSLAAPAPASPEQERKTQQLSEKVSIARSSSITPGPIKRKLAHSPSKPGNRHSKRREIKIVGFGDESPDSAGSAPALRQYREDSLRKFREARRSSTSLENLPRNVEKSGAQWRRDAMEVDPPAEPTHDAPVPAMSPRHISLYEEPSPGTPMSGTISVSHSLPASSPIVQTRTTSDQEQSFLHARPSELNPVPRVDVNNKSLNVFASFKKAYPAYTGDAKHFRGQCLQMIKLDQEDKMVPKWQWDDFIIRNRTDYKDYVLECLDRGDNPEPYHRFYKDTIRDTIYREGIIGGKSTLLQALQQLNVQVPAPDSPVPSQIASNKAGRSRASLPSAVQGSKASTKAHLMHDRSRHSLPTKSQHNFQTPAKGSHKTKVPTLARPHTKDAASSDRPTPKPNRLSRLSLDGTASPRRSLSGDTTPGASDPFRDAVFAYQRMTSLTGSTKVSSKRHRSERQQS